MFCVFFVVYIYMQTLHTVHSLLFALARYHIPCISTCQILCAVYYRACTLYYAVVSTVFLHVVFQALQWPLDICVMHWLKYAIRTYD